MESENADKGVLKFMPTVQQAIDDLREVIASTIASLEVWDTLYEVLNGLELGAPVDESQRLSKYKYLRAVTAAAKVEDVLKAARRMLTAYPGFRGKPSDSVLQRIQDDLWWIESQGVQKISNVSRYRIAETIEGVSFWGRFHLGEFFAPVVPGTANQLLCYDGKDGYLYSETIASVADAFLLGFQARPKQLTRISVVDCLRRVSFDEWPDQRFCLLLERMVHPEVQPPDTQRQLVAQFDAVLQHDGFELRQEDFQGGLPVFKIHPKMVGFLSSPKYIIFASSGAKPDIVIDDAVSMDIRVVRNADQCLVYDKPPPNDDLTWDMAVEWWSKSQGAKSDPGSVRKALGQRLRASLQSPPELFFFDTYFKALKPKWGASLPALFPQVYLHYDPRSQVARGRPVLARQRMDFLMLLRNGVRIVIEIDGVQHYADSDGRASPSRYAEMVAEDRRIKALGYEVYRFGGAEFVNRDQAERNVVAFFEELFSNHGIQPESLDTTKADSST